MTCTVKQSKKYSTRYMKIHKEASFIWDKCFWPHWILKYIKKFFTLLVFATPPLTKSYYFEMMIHFRSRHYCNSFRFNVEAYFLKFIYFTLGLISSWTWVLRLLDYFAIETYFFEIWARKNFCSNVNQMLMVINFYSLIFLLWLKAINSSWT